MRYLTSWLAWLDRRVAATTRPSRPADPPNRLLSQRTQLPPLPRTVPRIGPADRMRPRAALVRPYVLDTWHLAERRAAGLEQLYRERVADDQSRLGLTVHQQFEAVAA